MKKILIPTQFGDDEKKLMKYGVYLSRRLEAGILLYAPVKVVQPKFSEGAHVMTEAMNESFKEEKNKILNTYTLWLDEMKTLFQDSFAVDIEIDKGAFIPSVINKANELKPDLILMQGSKDGVIEKITGDSNEHILESVESPVMFVPLEHTFGEISTISYLTSYQNEHLDHINDFLLLVKNLNSTLIVFHPEGEDDYKHKLLKEGYIDKIRLIDGQLEITHITIDEKKKEDELIEHIKKHNIDMMVFFNEKRNILKQLFTEQLSQRLLAQLKIPILVYPE